MPEITLPQGFIPDTLSISQDGRVSVMMPGGNQPIQVGQIELYRFPNPVGLSSVGDEPIQDLQRLRPAHGGPTRA